MNRDDPPDCVLLRRFADGADEWALAVLLERYGGLVHHTALRLTGQEELAQEVSQEVFVALAKKAPRLAGKDAALAPWLYTATSHQARAVRRRERRHLRKLVAYENAMRQTPNEPSLPHTALVALDEVIGQLTLSEMRFLFQRFFEGRSFPEISDITGKSVAACEKQCQRLLQKLRAMLERRGTTLSVGALALGLSSEFARCGHPLDVREIIGAARVGSVSVCPVSVLNRCVLACGIVVMCQSIGNHMLAAQLESGSGVAEVRSEKRRSLLDGLAKRGGMNQSRSLLAFRHALESCIKRPDLLKPRIQFLKVLHALHPSDLPKAADLVAVSRLARADGLCREVFLYWGKVDLNAAKDRALQMIGELGPGWDDGHELVALEAVIDSLGFVHPLETLATIRELPVAPRIRNDLQSKLLQGVAKENPSAAIALLDSIDEPIQRGSAFRQIVDGWARANPVQAWQWVNTLSDHRERYEAVGQVMLRYARENQDEALRAALAVGEASFRTRAVTSALDVFARNSFSDAFDWVISQTEDGSVRLAGAPILGKRTQGLTAAEVMEYGQVLAPEEQSAFLLEAAFVRRHEPLEALSLLQSNGSDALVEAFLGRMRTRGDLTIDARAVYTAKEEGLP